MSRLRPPAPSREELLRREEQALRFAREEEDRRKSRALSKLTADLGARYAPERCSLDSYTLYHPGQKPVVERLRAITATWPDALAGGGGLVFFGPVGTGKDHLAAAMLYHAARAFGLEGRWYGGQELYGRFRDQINSGVRETEFMAEGMAPALLCISDPIPPAGDPTAWNLTQLYRLLDLRYRALKPTWVTVNAASPEEITTRLSQPVFDRLREGAEIIRCFWPSYRQMVKPN